VARIPRLAAAGATAPDGAAGPAFTPAPGDGPQPGTRQSSGQASRRALKNWRVQSRLFMLVVIPTVTAVTAGGIFIASSVEGALVNQRTLTLANLSDKITGLVQAVQNEREDTVRFIVLGSGNGGRGAPPKSLTPSGPELALLNQDYAQCSAWAAQVEALAGGIGGAYSALAQQDAQAAVTAIGDLPAIRAAATSSQLPAQNVIDEYGTAINSLLAIESQIAVGSSDSTLAGAVRVLGLVSSMKEEASQQQAVLTSTLGSDLVSLRPSGFGPAQQVAITNAQAQQRGNLNEFGTAATTDQRQLFNNALSVPNVEQALAQEQQAISLASSKSPIATDPTISDASAALTYVVTSMRSVEQQFADSVTSRSTSLHDSAIRSVVLFSLAVVLLLGVALGSTTLIGRSMVRPLRRLRNGALEIAEIRLPETVSRMSGADGASVGLHIAPIDVDSLDEIGEVARAFDQVHREAVRLAANEAALRGNVNAMFVNLSRRSQSLVERQIRVITSLEQSEQDSERLGSLFQVDHLATRMRRNSENLLVLAGQELSRRWGQPVALMDVIRAAVSEIEQYERVTLNVEPGFWIRRDAVRDVVHLVAELVENATSFSADETPVTIEAYPPSSGGVLIDITDHGVGMRPEAMAQANDRLENPPTVDVEVSRRMGLFVVAQLAARHGIRVRLRAAASSGLSAMVWLPPEAITQQAGGPGPQPPSGQVIHARETGMAASGGRQSIASVAEPITEHMDMADTARIRRRMRAGGLSAPPSTPDSEPAHGSGGQRAEIPQPVTGAVKYPPVNEGPAGWPQATLPGEVQGLATDPRARQVNLPIYDAVERDWFSGGRQVVMAGHGVDWSSPADDGWRAAEIANAPAADGTTRSGLPKRAPGANLVPGTAGASPDMPASKPQSPTAPGRSATENRNRLASYQRGIRQGRAAAVGADPSSGGDAAS
jgi:signal transduction histidine kinase